MKLMRYLPIENEHFQIVACICCMYRVSQKKVRSQKIAIATNILTVGLLWYIEGKCCMSGTNKSKNHQKKTQKNAFEDSNSL